MPRWTRLPLLTILTAGVNRDGTAMTTRLPPDIARGTWSALKILMTTATGGHRRSTARSGTREWGRDGRHIILDIGRGSIRGDGHGSMTRTGDTPHSITDAGRPSAADGDGCRDRGKCIRCMRRRWWFFLEVAWRSGAMSAGFRSDRAKSMCLRTA